MNILLNGCCGFMGREVVKLCNNGYRGARLVIGVDPCGEAEYQTVETIGSVTDIDCIVDFSHHSATPALVDFAVNNRIPLVMATTGHDMDEVEVLKTAAKKIPVFYSKNMSLGIALLIELARTAAAAMPDADIEIVEKHHNRKIDAPSGTAFMIADGICSVRPELYAYNGRCGMRKRDKNEIGIHAIRMGNVVGEHEVFISTSSQTITLKHEAHNRALFAEGALAAAEFIIDREPGLYDMRSMIACTDSANDTVISAD